MTLTAATLRASSKSVFLLQYTSNLHTSLSLQLLVSPRSLQVLMALAQDAVHVPFRDSTLTMLLKKVHDLQLCARAEYRAEPHAGCRGLGRVPRLRPGAEPHAGCRGLGRVPRLRPGAWRNASISFSWLAHGDSPSFSSRLWDRSWRVAASARVDSWRASIGVSNRVSIGVVLGSIAGEPRLGLVIALVSGLVLGSTAGEPRFACRR